jgi:hypothetical protein
MVKAAFIKKTPPENLSYFVRKNNVLDLGVPLCDAEL